MIPIDDKVGAQESIKAGRRTIREFWFVLSSL